VVRFHQEAPDNGGSSGLRVSLAGMLSTRVQFPGLPPRFYGALSVVACTSCCDLESMSSILIEHPILWTIISVVEYHFDIVKVAGSIPALSTIYAQVAQ